MKLHLDCDGWRSGFGSEGEERFADLLFLALCICDPAENASIKSETQSPVLTTQETFGLIVPQFHKCAEGARSGAQVIVQPAQWTWKCGGGPHGSSERWSTKRAQWIQLAKGTENPSPTRATSDMHWAPSGSSPRALDCDNVGNHLGQDFYAIRK